MIFDRSSSVSEWITSTRQISTNSLHRGRAFHRHYVQAPTCGASRYTLLTGTYGPADNGALFRRTEAMKGKSFPAWFRKHGYTTVSVGKVSHHPGGRGGPDWDDDAKPEMPGAWNRHLLPAGSWQHPRGVMHGLANGEIRKNAKVMDVFQSFDGPDTAYPDGLITDEALQQMNSLAKGGKPFFLAVGIIRPHLPFGAPAKCMKPYREAKLPATPHPKKPVGKTTWHGSGEFMKYNRWKRNPNTDAEFAIEVRKHYAACVTYADAMVGRLLARLDELKLRENTIIVLWGDHGWHLGEHAIWGKHALFEESLRSPLIISHSGLAKSRKGYTRYGRDLGYLSHYLRAGWPQDAWWSQWPITCPNLEESCCKGSFGFCLQARSANYPYRYPPPHCSQEWAVGIVRPHLIGW